MAMSDNSGTTSTYFLTYAAFIFFSITYIQSTLHTPRITGMCVTQPNVHQTGESAEKNDYGPMYST